MRNCPTGHELLPRRFLDAGNIPFQGFLPKTDSAEIEITHKGARTAAFEAAAHGSRREFRFLLGLYDH